MTAAQPQSRTAADSSEFDRFAAENPNISELETFIVDVNGNAIGKRLPIRDGRRAFEGGVAFSACAPILDCRGRGQNPGGLGGSDGDPDGVLVPTSGTLAPVPWTTSKLAQVMCAMRETATLKPLWFDPRVVLEQVLERCHRAGIHPVVACELEFYLVARHRAANGGLQLADDGRGQGPPRRPANLSLEAIEDNSALLAQVAAAAEAQDLPLCGTVAEYGVGQFEINLRHTADALLAADQAALLKRLVRGVARANQMDATFMAKPFLDQPGNGLHVHVSLANEVGRNRFGEAGGEQLLAHAVAGMQALMFDSVALFAPNFNSFRRFVGPFVPTTQSWGLNNRSVAFRIPAGGPADRRIEHRVAGADASPHLAVAAVLAAVLHGIENKLPPTDPTLGRASAAAAPAFPRSLHAALDRLAGADALYPYIEKRYLDAYVDLKRGECAALFEEISPREFDFYA
jgi:glutamine synthetase